MNKDDVRNLILTTSSRPGLDKLTDYLLNETDFVISPASTKYHLCHPGGLLEHSIHVWQALNTLTKSYPDKFGKISDESIFIVGFFHDVCKINFYKVRNDNQGYYVEDDLPLGHGEKSLYILSKFIELTNEEALAIRWHMGFSEPAVHFYVYAGASYQRALNTSPLVVALHMADLAATFIMES